MRPGDVCLLRAAGCAALLLLSAGRARAVPILAYAATSSGNFGTLDMTTGAFTFLGNSGVELCGLGELGTTLYGMACGANSQLYQVNTANGGLTAQGSASGVNVQNFGSTLTGLFAVDTSSPGNVYSINSSTGAATLDGSTGVSQFAEGALSTGSSTLFYSDAPGNNTESLYTITTTTGGANFVGAMSVGSSAAMTSFVLVGATLYGVNGDSSAAGDVDTINSGTAAVTFGPAVSDSTSGAILGLAPIIQQTSEAPEPGTWSLAGAGIAMASLLTRRRRR